MVLELRDVWKNPTTQSPSGRIGFLLLLGWLLSSQTRHHRPNDFSYQLSKNLGSVPVSSLSSQADHSNKRIDIFQNTQVPVGSNNILPFQDRIGYSNIQLTIQGLSSNFPN
ncbi:hypothetical protein M0802_002396 [Mischocyttarus mexicanus]|nr:hypothetical protein M0802_002396 [Mischocyttarus mexicanus]